MAEKYSLKQLVPVTIATVQVGDIIIDDNGIRRGRVTAVDEFKLQVEFDEFKLRKPWFWRLDLLNDDRKALPILIPLKKLIEANGFEAPNFLLMARVSK